MVYTDSYSVLLATFPGLIPLFPAFSVAYVQIMEPGGTRLPFAKWSVCVCMCTCIGERELVSPALHVYVCTKSSTAILSPIFQCAFYYTCTVKLKETMQCLYVYIVLLSAASYTTHQMCLQEV